MSMSWIEASLTHLEARLRAMIEGDASRDGIPPKFHNQLTHVLIQAMQAGVNKLQGENTLGGWAFTAPDQYTLVLPSDRAQILLSHPEELDRLAHRLETSAAQSNLLLSASPMLRVVADPSAQELRVYWAYSQAEKEDSFTIELDETPDEQERSTAGMMPKAFLIVNGLSTFPLTQHVINIGFDPANQLVLENPTVSRMHAQLRFISGRFVIFDLDSVGGTFVNGVSVSSHALSPGDVILLAGVPLVYGQDTAPKQGYTQELPVKPPPLEVL